MFWLWLILAVIYLAIIKLVYDFAHIKGYKDGSEWVLNAWKQSLDEMEEIRNVNK
jgi:hypothetical protein